MAWAGPAGHRQVELDGAAVLVAIALARSSWPKPSPWPQAATTTSQVTSYQVATDI